MFSVEPTRERLKDILFNTRNFLEQTKCETIADLKLIINKEYNKEYKYICKNWLVDVNTNKAVLFPNKQIKAYVNTLKFHCLSMIHMAEERWYTKTQDVLDLVNDKIEIFNF